MAQGDMFTSLFGASGKLVDAVNNGVISQRKFNALLESALEIESSIGETKADLLRSDEKSFNIAKKMLNVSKKVHKAMVTNKDTKKAIKEQDELINKLEKQSLKLKGADLALAKQIIDKKKVELLTNRLILDQQRRSIPVLGKMGKVGSFISDSFTSISSVLGGVGGVIGDIIGVMIKFSKMVLSAMLSPIKKVFGIFLELQSTVGNLAADIGLTHRESHTLLQNMSGLAIEASKFGGSMKDVAEIFGTFSSTTGKNRFFSKEEIGFLTELGLGTGLGTQGAAQLAASFDNIGISLDKTIKLTNKARNFAARYNINSTTLLKTYNELVTSLTGIGFGKGLDNLTKLAAKAQAMRFDIVSSTKAFTDVFFEPDKAAEAAAQMQVLGGAFAQSFGDPMQLAFESMNDPAKLAEKFAGLVKGMVTKTAEGDFIIPPSARKQLMLASQALGQDYEMIKGSAIEQAKITDKMTALGKQGLFDINNDDKPAIAALMKLNKNNKYEIQMSDGTTKLLENITDKRQLNAILDAREKNEKAAIERNNLAERLRLIADRFMLGFSTVMTKLFGSNEFDSFLSMVEKVGVQLADLVSNKLNGSNGFFQKVTKVFTEIGDLFTDPNKSFGQKITDALGKLGQEIALPLIEKVLKLVGPFLQYSLGTILSLMKDIPIVGGGFGKKGMEMQSNAINSDQTNILSGLTGKDLMTQINSKSGSSVPTMGDMGEGLMKGYKGAKGINTMIKGFSGAMGKKALSRIPVLGSLASAGFSIWDFMQGDITGGLLQAGSALANLGNIVAPGWGSAASLALDGIDASRQLGVFGGGNGEISSIKAHKAVTNNRSDFWSPFHSGSEQPTNATGGNSVIEHTGTIKIESPDGKVVTWDQMYNARDMVGASIQSLQQSYNGGFGNLQNANTLPIKPL
jgi:hypothetical protein